MTLARRRFLVAAAATAAGAAGIGVFAASRQSTPGPTPSPVATTGRRIRGARLATRFEGVAGFPVWSPDGSAICVQHSQGGVRMVAVYEVGSWSMRFATQGSLPAWAPDGAAVAVIDPFPTTIPVPRQNRVRVLNAQTGAERRSIETRAASLGWGPDGLVAAVAGEFARLESADVVQPGCDGACGIALWSADARYAATSDARSDEGGYQIRQSATGRTLADLGAARGVVSWASASPTLVGGFERGPVSWRPRGADALQLPPAYSPVVCSPDGEVILASTPGADRLNWTQSYGVEGKAETIDLPLGSIRGVTWSPDSRFLTSIPPTLGLSSQLEIFEVEFPT